MTNMAEQNASPKVTHAPHAHRAWPLLGMLKKEGREILPGLVAMILMGLSLYGIAIYANTPTDRAQRVNDYHTVLFRDEAMFIFHIIGLCLCGVVLGGIQFYKESKIDPYAFLVHRPISRARIFWCRILIAHVVIVLISLVPTISVYAWFSATNTVNLDILNTWFWRANAGILAASGCYFFGVLVVTRNNAKWYGSLFMPIMWALLMGIWAGFQQKPEKLIFLSILGLVPMCLASWGAFVSFSQVRIQSWPMRLSLGLVVLAGQLWVMVIFFAIFHNLMPRGNMEQEWVVPGIERDGTPVMINENDPHRSLLASGYKGQDLIPPFSTLRRAKYMPHLDPNWVVFRNYNELFSAQLVTIDDIRYTMSANSDKYFTLYNVADSYSKKVGILDAQGVKYGAASEPVPFSDHVMPISAYQVIVGNSIYDIGAKGKLFLKWRLPDFQTFTHIGLIRPRSNNQSELFIATSQHLYQINRTDMDDHGYLKIKKQWPIEPGQWEISLAWRDNPDDIIIRYDALDGSHSLLVFTRDNKRVTMPAPHQILPPMIKWPWGDILPFSSFGFAGRVGFATAEAYGRSTDWRAVINDELWKTKKALTINICALIISMLSAGIMWLWMSRKCFGRGQKILWSVLTFFFGPVIFMLRPTIAPRDVMELCPACHKKRPVELMACPHCQADWPAPPRDGREIVAS